MGRRKGRAGSAECGTGEIEMKDELEKLPRKGTRPKINCKWCGMGHPPQYDGHHWIAKSIIRARISIVECAYHKAGQVSPIQLDSEKATS